MYGADATVPALYEVTPHVAGGAISTKQRILSAASGRSLMAFQMSMHLDVPSPYNFITDLIMMGHARFLPSDPDGLFVKWALQAHHDPEWDIEYVIDFLCPLETAHRLLARGQKASGQLLRLVRSFDSASKMNILHLFVACGNFYYTNEILEKLRMFHHVYGLGVLTRTQDGRTVRALAAESRKPFSDHMREAVDIAVEEELLEQRCALVAARGLQRLPSSAIEMIGTFSGLPLGKAERAKGFDTARRSRNL